LSARERRHVERLAKELGELDYQVDGIVPSPERSGVIVAQPTEPTALTADGFGECARKTCDLASALARWAHARVGSSWNEPACEGDSQCKAPDQSGLGNSELHVRIEFACRIEEAHLTSSRQANPRAVFGTFDGNQVVPSRKDAASRDTGQHQRSKPFKQRVTWFRHGQVSAMSMHAGRSPSQPIGTRGGVEAIWA
jgi:hypothetical protein